MISISFFRRNLELLELAYWHHLHFMLIKIRRTIRVWYRMGNVSGLHFSMARLWSRKVRDFLYIIYLISPLLEFKSFPSTQNLVAKMASTVGYHKLLQSLPLPTYLFNFFNICFAINFVSHIRQTHQITVTHCLFHILLCCKAVLSIFSHQYSKVLADGSTDFRI